MKAIPDTSILIDRKITELIDKGKIEGKITIPEFVIDELENQANKGRETGYQGIKEIEEIRKKTEESDRLKLNFAGRKPTEEEIKMAANGRIDALIRDVAEETGGTLYTGDKVQARIAEAKGINVELYEKEQTTSFSLENYFDEETMSVHLKQDSIPKAKRGLPGNFKLEEIRNEKLTKDEIEQIITEIIEKAEISDDGLVEMEKDGAVVVQIENYRIAITRPPFSKKPEITAVRPVAKVSLDDYELTDKLLNRLKTEAEGILVAGAPGHGKSTFAQALAEYYEEQDQVVKTMEKPRDLDVGPDITQYTELEDSMEDTGDFLLLARPDYTVFDEVRKTSDFQVYSDMRMAGVGMIGIVHADQAVDAVQRLIGRVELGMIPQVCDTVIHIEDAQVRKVYKLELTVKVPNGMQEEDLARPVIQIKDFETDRPEYEIYTYGEETVVVPIKDTLDESGTQKLAKNQIKHELRGKVDNPRIEFISDNHIRLEVEENNIPQIIGKGGQNIDRIEEELGLDITVEPKSNTLKDSINYKLDEKGNSIVLELGSSFAGQEVDIYDGDEYLFSATVGKEGSISLTKSSDVAGRILSSSQADKLYVRG